MTDSHVHIGQYEDKYYDPLEVMDIVMSAGMEGMSFSTTSSCKDNILYQEIENEILSFLSGISYTTETIRPFFWYIPDYINQNITLESAFTGIPYKGIKIHPFAHNWDLNNIRHMDTLHDLFEYASRNNLPVLIHTGNSGIDNADRFERFMNEYSNTKCILAHCRPLDITIELLKKYNNVYCDTAFVPLSNILKIIGSGHGNKIIFGSDFPITHFYASKYQDSSKTMPVSLKEKYAEDISDWGAITKELKEKRTFQNSNSMK